MKMIREEIEAALKYAELQLALSTNDTKTRCFRTIVLLLRAELSRQENAPLTWNERINQMTVEEKAEWIKEYLFDSACEGVCMYNGCNGACTENIIAFFNSPYTEGETK